jgi:NAD(P)-dependent dehydrogenase (short-subunit alcohol dehydrogenase family)
MQQLAGKTAVVTGAASGIGLGIACALARAKVRVVLLDIDETLLAGARETVSALGTDARAYQLDVGDRAAVTALAKRVDAEVGPVHILCSNAGVAFRGPTFDETPDETFDWLIDVNITGMFNVVKAFVTPMRAHRQGGHVVLTGSVAGLFAMIGRPNSVYSAAKMAIVGFAEYLHASLPPEGIGVSVLCPGNVATRAQQSGRWRQARYGGPFERPDANATRAGMNPDDVGRIVVRAIQDDTFYIFTHPAARSFVRDRFEGIMADFDRWERVLPELGIDPKMPAV